jgi:Uma2 family endonuclease
MPAVRLYQRVSPEEYLEGEVHSQIKHEYIDGDLRAMAGASDNHELVAMNIAAALLNHLRGKGCRVYKSDMKVRLNYFEADVFFYPDVMVTCDPTDNHALYKERPKLVIEVLSKDENRDLIEKHAAYQGIETVEEYAAIKPDLENPELYLFRRANGWRRETFSSGEFTLASVGLTMALAELTTV